MRNNRLHSARAADVVLSFGDRGSDEARLHAVTGLRVAKDGRIYVLEGRECVVKVFDAAGKFLLSFGKKGMGTGEFVAPQELIVDDSTVTIRDMANPQTQPRVVVFTLDGKHVSSKSVVRDQWLQRTYPLRNKMELIAPPMATMSPAAVRRDPRYNVVLLKRPSTKQMDTVVKIRMDYAFIETDAGGASSPSGFGTAGAWALSGDSLLTQVDGYTGIVKWFSISASGAELVRTDSLRKSGRPVTHDDVKAELARRAAMPVVIFSGGTGGGGSRVDRGEPPSPSSFKMLNPPPQWSVATTARFASDGSFWIAVIGRANTAPGEPLSASVQPVVWTVFPPKGAPFTVELPGRYSVAVIRDDKVYGYMRTDDLAFVVTVYQLAVR